MILAPPTKTVFVTSLRFTGDLITEANDLGLAPSDGLDAGDKICQKLADDAVLAGTYLAWLAVAGNSPLTRFVQSPVPYVRTDGVQIADDWGDLVDGTLDARLNRDELVVQQSIGVWTGVDATGAEQAPRCSDWTTSMGSPAFGQVGASFLTNSRWTTGTTASCNNTQRLYCFEQ